MQRTVSGKAANTPSGAVIRALAEVEEVDPLDLDFSMYECVDLDALDRQADHDGSVWEFEFDAGGHDVTVDSEGTVVVDGRFFFW